MQDIISQFALDNPVLNPQPDFHCPAFFAELKIDSNLVCVG